MAPFDYLICVSFISLLARPIMAKKKSDGQLNLSGTSLSPTISIRFIPFLSFVCGAERSRFYISACKWGKKKKKGLCLERNNFCRIQKNILPTESIGDGKRKRNERKNFVLHFGERITLAN